NTYGTGTVTINGGTIQSTSANRSATNAVTLGGNFTSANATNLTFSGPTTLTGDRAITVNSVNLTFSGAVGETGGARSITKLGSGALQLNVPNSYSGNTIISNGAVQVDGDGTPGNGAGTLVLAGGTFQSSASRTVTTAPIGNPVSMNANSIIATISTAATVDLN